MAKALYRKYRSKTLDEVVGQKHITNVLSLALKKGMISHAYLLTGPRGVGKTSIARILAHEINQLPYDGETNHIDIIEIDAASNNGVEDVRDLRDKVQIAPVSASKKVYIIDEVHMLSKPAFNALLKTLEEPPEHVVFILATTDPDKLPATIISRTQQFGFRSITKNDVKSHLEAIAKSEKIKIDEDALDIIATMGEGSFRDSIGLLDQLSSLSDEKTGITAELVESTLGLAPSKVVEQLLGAVNSSNVADIIKILDDAESSGVAATALAAQLIEKIRREIAAQPQLVGLLDSLLDVNRSPRPDLKLLTILVMKADNKSRTKNAALSIPTPSISAPIKMLEKQAVKEHPKIIKVAAPVIKEVVEQPIAAHTVVTTAKISDIPFEWQALVEHCRSNFVAVYSVISKCGYQLENEKLVIYTGNNFYKKKIDSGKHHIDLMQSLEAIGASGLIVETVPSAPPPKDSKAAAVAAIMGGGEEVSVDL